ncbi:MAG TPA: tetratricopeptide repeat protein, partial [Myxococcota bacterium]|nr:tetratricopeptide repeat protein [Myxococcota bacterium]
VSTPISSDDETLKPARLVWPFVLVGVLACAAVGLFLAREPLLALVAPKHAPAPTAAPSPQVQARVAFAEGVRSYASKDFGKAIGAFDQALSLDPTLADAHRSLGIVYATTKDQAKAVDHYKRYLALSPTAPDAAEVQKIVDDYAKAQAPAVTEPPKPEAAPAIKGKKVKGKKGKR